MEKKIVQPGLYPVVVRQSRYSGIYEGGLWFAMPCHGEIDLAESYVDYLHGDDCDAVDFWDSDMARTFGVGGTPDEAVADLLAKHNDVQARDDDDSAYIDIRNQFQLTIEKRKETFVRNSEITSYIHLERTTYFEKGSGYKNDDKL